MRKIGKFHYFIFSIFWIMLSLSIGTASPVKGIKVTKVEVSVSPENFTGFCPKKFIFTARISATGRGTVRYRWIRSDGATSPPKTLSYSLSSTKTVTSYWELGAAGKTYRNYWKAIEILEPRRFVSERAIFSLNCLRALVAIRNEISGRLSASVDGHNIGGRKVKIILRKDGSVERSLEISLDREGNANYRFTLLSLGTHTITVEKGSPDPENYTSSANWCFDGTTPSIRRVTLDSTHRTATNQNFIINYHLAWDRSGICW